MESLEAAVNSFVLHVYASPEPLRQAQTKYGDLGR